jgi:spore maturation protein CgeB
LRRRGFSFGGWLKITIFGLTLSSSWGNGHATPFRAIVRALHRQGVQVAFYEKEAPYYAAHRDFDSCEYCDLHLYADWNAVRNQALREASDSDIVVVASYVPDGARISDEVLDLSGPLRVFYDLDTPVTLKALERGPLPYLRSAQIPAFDLYLSFTGGDILVRLKRDYGARKAGVLYGCVDPDMYFRLPASREFACSLSYLGTYAGDRQQKLDDLFLESARRRPDLAFVLAGSLYPDEWSWPRNVTRYRHVAPANHPALYSSARATLNITRADMFESGYCPSGRFFEAAACGTPIFTDRWQGLGTFFDVQRELCVVESADDVLARLTMTDVELGQIAAQARLRTLDEHTGQHRAAELLSYCDAAKQVPA